MGINIDQHFRKLRDDVRGLDLEVDCINLWMIAESEKGTFNSVSKSYVDDINSTIMLIMKYNKEMELKKHLCVLLQYYLKELFIQINHKVE